MMRFGTLQNFIRQAIGDEHLVGSELMVVQYLRLSLIAIGLQCQFTQCDTWK